MKGGMMATKSRTSNRHKGTAVTVWLDLEELKRLDEHARRLRLDRSKLLKFLIGSRTSDELVIDYITKLKEKGEQNA